MMMMMLVELRCQNMSGGGVVSVGHGERSSGEELLLRLPLRLRDRRERHFHQSPPPLHISCPDLSDREKREKRRERERIGKGDWNLESVRDGDGRVGL